MAGERGETGEDERDEREVSGDRDRSQRVIESRPRLFVRSLIDNSSSGTGEGGSSTSCCERVATRVASRLDADLVTRVRSGEGRSGETEGVRGRG